MIAYHVDVFDTASSMLKGLEVDMPEINRRILGVLCEEVVSRSQTRYLRGGHPLNRRTGKLAQSLTYKVYRDTADVGTNLPYAAIHEFGGVIRPGVKGFLAWRGPDGKWIYTRKPVEMPARPYLRPALDDIFQTGRAVTVIDRVLRQEIDKRVPA